MRKAYEHIRYLPEAEGRRRTSVWDTAQDHGNNLLVGLHAFFIRTSEFWPSLVLKFLHNLSLDCSCFHPCQSFSLVFKNTCGTVLIFFSAHSVFLTAEKPARKRYM